MFVCRLPLVRQCWSDKSIVMSTMYSTTMNKHTAIDKTSTTWIWWDIYPIAMNLSCNTPHKVNVNMSYNQMLWIHKQFCLVREQGVLPTCARCKDYEHFDLHLERGICHPLYLNQVAKGTHTDHWSAKASNIWMRWINHQDVVSFIMGPSAKMCNQRTYPQDCKENSTTTLCRQYNKNDCVHNLTSVTHKVWDYYMHYE